MALAGDAIEFVRLENMRPDQVRDALMTSSVYMDFGHHPGRDRIPREAAVCGCCVVTGRKGSAANDADVPIGSIYKIDESSADFAEQAVQILTKILDEPVKYSADFDDYRRIIEKQKKHSSVRFWPLRIVQILDLFFLFSRYDPELLGYGHSGHMVLPIACGQCCRHGFSSGIVFLGYVLSAHRLNVRCSVVLGRGLGILRIQP